MAPTSAAPAFEKLGGRRALPSRWADRHSSSCRLTLSSQVIFLARRSKESLERALQCGALPTKCVGWHGTRCPSLSPARVAPERSWSPAHFTRKDRGVLDRSWR